MQFGDFRYSKLHKTTWTGKKPKEGFEVTPCETSFTEGHALANYTKKKSLIPPLRKVRFQLKTKKGQKYLVSGQSRQLMQETRKFAPYQEIIN